MAFVPKRGAAKRGLELLTDLRTVLRAETTPERMLCAVAALLAVGDKMCVVDVADEPGTLRRLTIAHADPSLRERLRVAVRDARLEPRGRVARLLESGKSELIGTVSRAMRAGALADVSNLSPDLVRSYMATPISVSGSSFGLLTVVATRNARPFDRDDLTFLETVGGWTGLGLENALRREAQPRESQAPAPRDTPRPMPSISR